MKHVKKTLRFAALAALALTVLFIAKLYAPVMEDGASRVMQALGFAVLVVSVYMIWHTLRNSRQGSQPQPVEVESDE